MVRDELPPQRAHQPRQILRRARGVPGGGGGGGLREIGRCERGERDAGQDCVVVDFQRGRGGGGAVQEEVVRGDEGAVHEDLDLDS